VFARGVCVLALHGQNMRWPRMIRDYRNTGLSFTANRANLSEHRGFWVCTPETPEEIAAVEEVCVCVCVLLHG